MKDAYAARVDDRWRFAFSDVVDDPFRFRVGAAATTDWRGFAVEDPLEDGSTETTTFQGRGHAKLGLARSVDLVDREVPFGR